jgi:hypothetical protein|tara:strand:- start:107 stop:442 length:336 start_codon:yes stop_codon:yes gene_type:complete
MSKKDIEPLSFEVPLDCAQASRALGVCVRTLFDIRKKYRTKIEVCEMRGRKPVFYEKHINNIREVMKCENKMKDSRAGIHSGRTGRGATISVSRETDIAGRRASAIRKRLK